MQSIMPYFVRKLPVINWWEIDNSTQLYDVLYRIFFSRESFYFLYAILYIHIVICNCNHHRHSNLDGLGKNTNVQTITSPGKSFFLTSLVATSCFLFGASGMSIYFCPPKKRLLAAVGPIRLPVQSTLRSLSLPLMARKLSYQMVKCGTDH